jgi:hypothetical protein
MVDSRCGFICTVEAVSDYCWLCCRRPWVRAWCVAAGPLRARWMLRSEPAMIAVTVPVGPPSPRRFTRTSVTGRLGSGLRSPGLTTPRCAGGGSGLRNGHGGGSPRRCRSSCIGRCRPDCRVWRGPNFSTPYRPPRSQRCSTNSPMGHRTDAGAELHRHGRRVQPDSPERDGFAHRSERFLLERVGEDSTRRVDRRVGGVRPRRPHGHGRSGGAGCGRDRPAGWTPWSSTT